MSVGPVPVEMLAAVRRFRPGNRPVFTLITVLGRSGVTESPQGVGSERSIDEWTSPQPPGGVW